ncbi:MAG: hypothetical protein ACYSWZ_11960 [Planctomycetota bacterium]|jgi:hypothetical protein
MSEDEEKREKEEESPQDDEWPKDLDTDSIMYEEKIEKVEDEED